MNILRRTAFFMLCMSILSPSLPAIAEVEPQWVRYPAISPDASTIAFTYKGDIYSVAASGGQAQRLTFHKSHDFKPVWSKDGSQIAFASDRFGNFDVFVMDAKGGQAERLTFHSTNEIPSTFSHDNTQILFEGARMDTAAHRQFPSARLGELYSVPRSGGAISQVFTHTAQALQVNSDGTQFIYQDDKGTENPWRKHHKSAATRDVWSYDVARKTHRQITTFIGEDRDPVYAEDESSVYYLSEQNGTFNVYQLNLENTDTPKQLTNFNLHPVRFLSHANNTLAFTHHGELYTMDVNGTPTKIKLSIRTQDVENSQELLAVNGEISDMSISPNGKEIAFIARGDVFVSNTDGTFTKQITHTADTEASVSFSPEGDYVLYSSERDGKWSIYKAEKQRAQEPFFYAATLINESVLLSNERDNYQPKLSPDGKKLAYVEDRRTIKVLDLSNNESVTVLDKNNTIHFRDGDQNFSWSPDSQWILLQHDKLLNNADIAIVDASGEQTKQVLVPSGYYDFEPKWVNGGQQIIWFSNREGLRSYATSGRSQSDVYTMFFTKELWDKFNLSEDDFALVQAIEEAEKEAEDEENGEESASDDEDASEEDTSVSPLNIEWDGLDRRIARLTIHSSLLADAVLNKEADTLYYLSEFEDKHDLWETNLRTQETRKVMNLGARGGSLMWDPDMENLYLLSGGSIAKLDLENESRENINISEQMLVDHDAIRQKSFEHVWLRTSKIFYEPTFHGIDWNLMREEYRGKVAHVANGHEFTELLSEMLGELNVSHAGAGYRSEMSNADNTGELGIFYDFSHNGNGNGIKIVEVIKDGPLDKAAFDLSSGDIIQKINGVSVDVSFDWSALLNRTVDKFVLLDIYKPSTDKTVQITVKPISSAQQNDLLYQRFVKTNEQEVLESSQGQLGYVHIPSMSDGPYRSIYDDIMGRFFDKKGIVVDARFNRGGDLVADLAMFFTGEAFITYARADQVVGTEPTSRYTKPIVSIFNEAMYSDGHCYASGYTDLKLGKSIGMPVPGTCSFAGWESLPGGGYWGVVPVSAKNKAGEWMENNQTTPDIIIKNSPSLMAEGRDQQLERSINELLNEL
ncbi:S41 family peptidase [Glaciecola siphonariae]|uniref:Tricorn protease homolog n=1 Tax=Glaciecola siphonariae TaxID=521012 RepID=A0ABV9LRB3_9ALTE